MFGSPLILSFVGKFLITASISSMICGLFRFSISSDPVLVGCMFLGIYPFLLCCPICWHVTVHSILLLLLFSVVSIVISPLAFILFIWVLFLFFFLFFFTSSWLILYQFCLSFIKQALGFVDHFYCFLFF